MGERSLKTVPAGSRQSASFVNRTVGLNQMGNGVLPDLPGSCVDLRSEFSDKGGKMASSGGSTLHPSLHGNKAGSTLSDNTWRHLTELTFFISIMNELSTKRVLL